MCRVREWIIYDSGAALLVADAVLATSVVAPRLRSRGLKDAACDNYI